MHSLSKAKSKKAATDLPRKQRDKTHGGPQNRCGAGKSHESIGSGNACFGFCDPKDEGATKSQERHRPPKTINMQNLESNDVQ